MQVLLCSVSGDIFPKQVHHRNGSEDIKAAYLARLMTALQRWCVPVQQALNLAQQDETELVDACR